MPLWFYWGTSTISRSESWSGFYGYFPWWDPIKTYFKLAEPVFCVSSGNLVQIRPQVSSGEQIQPLKRGEWRSFVYCHYRSSSPGPTLRGFLRRSLCSSPDLRGFLRRHSISVSHGERVRGLTRRPGVPVRRPGDPPGPGGRRLRGSA